jgi:membrane-bound inhibitor of C-type lysozyme
MPVPSSHALMLAGLLALTACSDPGGRTAVPAPAPASTGPSAVPPVSGAGTPVLVYHCADGQTVRASYPSPDAAVVEYGGLSRTLKATTAASGARYVGNGLQWWTKGPAEGVISPLDNGQDAATAPGVNCARSQPATAQAVPNSPAPATPPAASPQAATPLGPDPVVSPEPPRPDEALVEPSRDLGGVLPLKHGIFVAADVPCESPPNAAIRRYDGVGLSGAHTRACRAKVLSKKGATYEVDQSCIDAGSGPAPRSSERQTITVASNLEFMLKREAGTQRFKYCAAALLPPGLR